MKRNVTSVGLLTAAVLLVVIGVAAKFQGGAPHPIFDGLVVGERVGINGSGGQWEIRNYSGNKRLEELGPDYLIYSERGKRYAIHINHISIVEIR